MWINLKRDILEVFSEAQRSCSDLRLHMHFRAYGVTNLGMRKTTTIEIRQMPRCLKCSAYVVGGHPSKKNKAWWYCALHIDPRARANR